MGLNKEEMAWSGHLSLLNPFNKEGDAIRLQRYIFRLLELKCIISSRLYFNGRTGGNHNVIICSLENYLGHRLLPLMTLLGTHRPSLCKCDVSNIMQSPCRCLSPGRACCEDTERTSPWQQRLLQPPPLRELPGPGRDQGRPGRQWQ